MGYALTGCGVAVGHTLTGCGVAVGHTLTRCDEDTGINRILRAETCHDFIQHSKYVIQTQQQRPEWPTVTLTWHAGKYKVHKLHQSHGTSLKMDAPPPHQWSNIYI